MRIAIAAELANQAQPTGVEHYTRELILGLSRIDSSNDYLLYFRTPPQEWCAALPRNFTLKCLPARVAWTQLRLSAAMIADRPDALLIPSFSMPVLHPRNSIVTIHDLAWLLFPESENTKQRLSLTFTHWFAKLFARRLIAVSAATKRDLVNNLHLQGDRVEVIHHGFASPDPVGESVLSPVENEVAGVTTPFIVCLGTLQPRKNLSRLIDAFVQMKLRSGLPHSLVIAGRKGWMCDGLLAKIAATKSVRYLGYVEDRFALLKGADLLIQPSLYEGFGLSVLDAFAQGVPVACSNLSSLPEVVGNAAELFDPYRVDSIAAAMSRVLSDQDRADQLRGLGCTRLSQFSWDLCARKTLAVLQEEPAKRQFWQHGSVRKAMPDSAVSSEVAYKGGYPCAPTA